MTGEPSLSTDLVLTLGRNRAVSSCSILTRQSVEMQASSQ